MSAHKKKGILAGIIVAVLAISFLAYKQMQLWRFKEPAGEIEAFLVAELPKAKQVIIYSLEPYAEQRRKQMTDPPSNRPLLHQWEILGQVEVHSAEEREIIGAAFLDSSRLARDERAACFSPRHGIKLVTADGRETSFVLCFQCNAVVAYGLPDGNTGAYLGDLGQSRLNHLLDKYGIKRDDPSHS